MKLVLASLALLATASSVADADDAPPPPAYVELTVGASILLRNLANDQSPGDDDVTSVGVRGGYPDASPGGPVSAHRERALVGMRLASRRGSIGGFLRLGVGVERSTLWVEERHDSDFGPAAELGGGALARFRQVDLGAEVTLGTQSHDGERLYLETVTGDGTNHFNNHYVGIEAGLQVFAGYRF